MRRHLTDWSLTVLALPLLALLAYACNGGSTGPPNGATPLVVPVPSPFAGITSQVVVPDAAIPIAMGFAPDGRLFYAERDTGKVRIVGADGQLVVQPFVQLGVALGTGWGLLGLALDPDFETNHFVYLYSTRPAGDKLAKPIVVRYTDANNKGTTPSTIIDDFPEATLYGEYFVGGAMRFGPDGYLYIAVGDHVVTSLSQDLSSVRGKILRVNKEDGSAAPDNPFVNDSDADPRVFAYGFLDAEYLTFGPATGDLFVTEAGTYFCCDEVDRVEGGKNYGWPHHIGLDQKDSPPVHLLAFPGLPPEGYKVNPAGIEFVSGDVYPALGDSLLVCEAATKYMRRLVLTPNQATAKSDDVVVADCSLSIVTSPDGTIYYGNDAEIRRLVQS